MPSSRRIFVWCINEAEVQMARELGDSGWTPTIIVPCSISPSALPFTRQLDDAYPRTTR
jgi:hypothetical protein